MIPYGFLLHHHPFGDMNPTFGNVIYPNIRARPVFMEGIEPALKHIFNLQPSQFPFCFHIWHSLVHQYASHRLEHCNQHHYLPVTVSCHHETIVVTFYPTQHLAPIVIIEGDNQLWLAPLPFLLA